jgi:hypothetical protein
MIITAAEQQTMNYYMNITNLATNDMSRKLYMEIAQVEEEHVTQYESLMDSSATWLEMLLWHEYCECYLYWSCFVTETDAYVKSLWEENFEIEVAHLHKAAELLERFEGKHYQEVIPDGEFPAPISLHENVDYVRNILKNTVCNTAILEDYTPVSELPESFRFFRHNDCVNGNTADVASHKVIGEYITEFGEDYRFEETPHPVPELRDRTCDNTEVGR